MKETKPQKASRVRKDVRSARRARIKRLLEKEAGWGKVGNGGRPKGKGTANTNSKKNRKAKHDRRMMRMQKALEP